MSCHQVLHRPDPLFGLIGDGHPGLSIGYTPPDDVVCDLRATVVLWWKPGQRDPLRSDLLKLNGSRRRTRSA